jgi:hypothetical protein
MHGICFLFAIKCSADVAAWQQLHREVNTCTMEAFLFELLHEDYHPGVRAGQHDSGLII